MRVYKQLVGERYFYRFAVSGDTIADVEWSVDNDDATLSHQQDASDNSMVMLSCPSIGKVLLRCKLTLDSDQISIGQATVYIRAN